MAEKERIGKAIATSIHMKHLIYQAVDEGITATAGGGQANAAPLNGQINRATTVATTGDSVGLPPSVPGMAITVINASANTLDVYPYSGDAINALSANAAYTLATTKVCIFSCTIQGQWHTLLSA